MSKAGSSNAPVIPTEAIEQKIYVIRGNRVMLDPDLAKLYRVPTFRFE